MLSNRKPWPLPVLYGGMAAFGAAAAAMGLGLAQVAALGAMVAFLAWGRP